MKILPLIYIIILCLVSGCTSTQILPLSSSLNVSKVCIEKNEKVIVPNFLKIIRAGFKRHGIETEVINGVDQSCSVTCTYTALRSWDFTPYLSHAELLLRNKNGKRIAYAEYHLVNGGGFALNKWASTDSKMNPVIDKLLAGYK